jgi:4-hydroxybenzoate polyprenyltransferase
MRPLCVDLDGSLVSTDLLHECFVSAVRGAPWVAILSAFWLLRGIAHLKRNLAERADFDVSALPYRDEVVSFLREERRKGRRVVLATASWQPLAQRVADHLGLFDEVIATTSGMNLKGAAKAQELVRRFGERGFDYLGNSPEDLPVWRVSEHAYVVDGGGRLADAVAPHSPPLRVFAAAGFRDRVAAALRAARPYQWSKNLLVLVPLIAAHRVGEAPALLQGALAFAAFCLTASSAYIANDLADLGADRLHPRKRHRPFAAGHLPIPLGAAIMVATLAGAAGLAALLSAGFQLSLAAYLALTIAYSLALKRVAMLDVISLAALYALRIVAGGFAIGAPVSFWLLAFAMFLFFSLALVKRYSELLALEEGGARTAPGRGYSGHDAEVVLAIGTASGMVSALVLALYINGETAKDLYSRPVLLWLLCPILLYWISRMWLLAARGQMHDDPVLFAVRDRASYLVAAAGLAVVWVAT